MALSLRAAIAAALMLATAGTVVGAELQVPVSVAMRGAVAEVAQAFEKKTGHTVKIKSMAPGQITASLKAGDVTDVIVQVDSALAEVEGLGLVKAGRVALAMTGFGIATRASDPTPDISTADALRAVFLSAGRVIYNDPAVTPSGKLLLSIAEKLGVADQVKAKSQVVGPGANVVTLAKDASAGPVITLAVLVEIPSVAGARTIGPLPRELQVPLPYSAMLGAKSTDAAAAQAFIEALATPEARQAYVRVGFEVK